MRIFLTGASGFIGSLIARDLLGKGHEVVGLARSDATAAALQTAGVAVHRGELTDLASLRRGAANSDGVIHTAFIHDFSKFQANIAVDHAAVEALGEELAGTGRALVIASGTAVSGFLAPGRLGAEDDDVPAALPRMAAEHLVVALAQRNVRSSVVRLPPSVHDPVRLGLISQLIDKAKEARVSAYVADGANRWPAVHVVDAAVAIVLAFEKGVGGSRYHAVGDQGVPVKAIAEIIARRLGVPAVSQTPEEAVAHFGWLGPFLGLDCPSSSAKTQATLGWEPMGPGVLEDLEQAAALAG